MSIPKKPDDIVIGIYNLGTIVGIAVERMMIDQDEFDTMVTLTGSGGQVTTISISAALRYLVLELNNNMIASLRPEFQAQVERWKVYDAEFDPEYEYFLQLYSKYGQPGKRR